MDVQLGIIAYIIGAVLFFIGSAWVDSTDDNNRTVYSGDAGYIVMMTIIWPLAIAGMLLYFTMELWLRLRRWFANRRRANGEV